MFAFLQPAPRKPRLPDAEVRRRYPWLRWQILEATFLGYSIFYLTRNNLSNIHDNVGQALGYTSAETGSFLAATAIAYGVGKFLMGAWSDRSNPRYFMALGLALTALCNIAFGAVSNYYVHLGLWTLNGVFQGMGWAPCGRSLGHWYSENERGTIFAFWNIAHNVGGGLAGLIAALSLQHLGWQYAFYVPAVIAMLTAVYLVWRLRDTPQSEGLPSIEEHRQDYPAERPHAAGADDTERELTTREIFLHHILPNKYLWLFACANFFVYIARYGMLDWGPAYLKAVKGADISAGGWSTVVLEFAGIPSTILMGWLSDRLSGRRGLVSFVCMIPVVLAFYVIYHTPADMRWLDFAMLGVIGFFVYPPVMLLGVAGLDLTSKKAVGTAAGFIGLFGYFGRAVMNQSMGMVVDDANLGWSVGLDLLLYATMAGVVLLAFTVRIKPRA